MRVGDFNRRGCKCRTRTEYQNDDEYADASGTWSALYEGNEDIENQDSSHIRLIAKYLINNHFSRSGEHLLKNLNPLWETCKI